MRVGSWWHESDIEVQPATTIVVAGSVFCRYCPYGQRIPVRSRRKPEGEPASLGGLLRAGEGHRREPVLEAAAR